MHRVEMEQEINAGEDYQHCIRVCDDTWCVSTVSVSVDSCGWFKANFKILSIRLTVKTLSNLGRWVGGNGLGTGQHLGVNVLVSAVLAS